MNINEILLKEFSIKKNHLENTIELIDEGNTIPFIARYRKELTGSLDDQVLRELHERLLYLRNLKEKKEQVLKLIDEQGKLSPELEKAVADALTVTEIDDIYRPFRPKRRTRATIAKEKGLEPLAVILFEQHLEKEPLAYAQAYVDEEKGVATPEEALQGAQDIISEMISDDAEHRKKIRNRTFQKGTITSKGDKEQSTVYEMYYDYYEPIKNVAGHRVLALNRGESEKILTVKIEPPAEEILEMMKRQIIKKDASYVRHLLEDTIEDSYKRLIEPSIEREIRNDLTQQAQEGAIKVFSENLKQLLLSPPIKDQVVLALDPGFRTGCKTAVIDGTGKVLDTGVIYPVPPVNKIAEAEKKVMAWIEKHQVDIVCIGNGTASRETELFAVNVLKQLKRQVHYIIVNEAGASVYSASKLGAQEFPDYDVALRSAVSIGRRLQDPLAELVKIDPKSIGVGQYQHDMNQKRLGEALGGVVESCVNNVGVDLNTASPSLLSYVAGINGQVAKNILQYREENGKFKTRRQLLKVAKLGPKAYEQCAGFLRISDGTEPFDGTGVHPESYGAAERLLKKLGYSKDAIANRELKGISRKIADMQKTAEEMEIGVPTLQDIIKELEKPGRDPREDVPPPILRSDILEMKDLKEGMELTGTVRNVIDFGIFVDIGVHQDGLVHISQICDRYIKHPLEAVSVGDIVKVRVLSVDEKKKRIALTMKAVK